MLQVPPKMGNIYIYIYRYTYIHILRCLGFRAWGLGVGDQGLSLGFTFERLLSGIWWLLRFLQGGKSSLAV